MAMTNLFRLFEATLQSKNFIRIISKALTANRFVLRLFAIHVIAMEKATKLLNHAAVQAKCFRTDTKYLKDQALLQFVHKETGYMNGCPTLLNLKRTVLVASTPIL